MVLAVLVFVGRHICPLTILLQLCCEVHGYFYNEKDMITCTFKIHNTVCSLV